jgi:hypothetical protein
MLEAAATILLLANGYMLASLLFTKASVAGRLAGTLLLAITAVPFLVITIAFPFSIHISTAYVLGAAVVLAVMLIPLVAKNPSILRLPATTRGDLIAIAVSGLVAVFAAAYYSNSEYLLSVASYLQLGQAKCFYMQTFKLIGALNPGAGPETIREAYSVITTPGNVMYPAGLMPLLGDRAYHVLYVVFLALIFLYVYLLVLRFTERTGVAIAAGMIAALNPYVLSCEVLDRNIIAFALTAALFHTVLEYKDRPIVHGLLFGIAAGTGLRFLPITLVVPVFIFYWTHKAKRRDYPIFLAAGAVTWAFNLPHLFQHGFHSLGESTPLPKLLFEAFTAFPRTPFLPFPNFVYYLLNAADYLGLLACGLILIGAAAMFRRSRSTFFALLFVLLPTYLVLAAQRDWIEGEKARILLGAFLPLAICAGMSLALLLDKKKLVRNVGLFAGAVAFSWIAAFGLAQIKGEPDLGMGTRKPTYQSENETFARFFRTQFARVGLFPDYQRLFRKIDLSRKNAEYRATYAMLFGGKSDLTARAGDYLPKPLDPPKLPVSDTTYVNLRIDMDKLVTDIENAATVVSNQESFFVNLEDKKGLLDIYYKECDASWQPEKLPATVMTESSELNYLNELVVELNAFVSFGADEYGFVKVNSVNFMVQEKHRAAGLATAMTALPQTESSCAIIVRIPSSMEIVLRNWIVDGTLGVPHRIDSWRVRLDGRGEPVTEFYPFEPESYL